MTHREETSPPAIVLGRMGIEIVRPLSMAGIPCGIVAPPGDPAALSRHARRVFDWDWGQPMVRHDRGLAERFLRYAESSRSRPVLMPCSDESMLFVSRFRRELAEGFRFVVPDADLLEALANKSRFADLARKLGLPVPVTRVLAPGAPPAPDEVEEIGLPFVLKPTKLDRSWGPIDPLRAKAVLIRSLDDLDAIWPRVAALGAPVIAQQFIPGPETHVESYHAYVGEDGEIVAEFTGRKIRTLPERFGYSTALTITEDPVLRDAGSSIVRTLGLRGVAKLDFKRGPGGRLNLLEVNARLTLWNHLAARAGLNVPAMIHADLTGRPRPAGRARPGATWFHPKDVVAARRAAVPLGQWIRWAMRADAIAFWSPTDPLPLLGLVGVRVRHGIRTGRPGRRSAGPPTPEPGEPRAYEPAR